MEDQQNHKVLIEKEQKQVTRIYAALVAMLIFSCVPNMVLGVLAILLMFYAIIGAYVLRAGTAEDSVVRNHMTYLIRTFWISSLIFVLGAAAAVPWLWRHLDFRALDALANDLGTDPEKMQALDPHVFMTATGLTVPDLLTGSAIMFGPCMIYFIYRVARGLSRALKGYRMNDVKAWF